MLPTEKSFVTLPKNSRAAFILESFALNLYISTLLTNNYYSSNYNVNLNKFFSVAQEK